MEAGRWINGKAPSLSALVVLILIIAAGLRFHELGVESYWLDEVTMARLAQGTPQSILSAFPGRPPLFPLIAHYWTQLFDVSETAARLLSVFAGIISVSLIYRIGRALFGSQIGLISALLMTVSSFQIYYSQELRYYSLTLLFVLFMFFFYIRALKGGRWRDFILFALSATLVVYAHPTGIYVLPVPGLFFLARWQRYRELRWRWFWSHALLVLATAPIVMPRLADTLGIAEIGAASNDEDGLRWLTAPSLLAPFGTLLRFLFLQLNHLNLVSFGGTLAFVAVCLLGYRRYAEQESWPSRFRNLSGDLRRLWRTRREALLLVGCWLVVPLLIPWILSKVVWPPVYLDRYVIAAAPAFYLLLAASLVVMNRLAPRFITHSALILLMGAALYQYYERAIKEQWREAAAYVAANAGEGDSIGIAFENYPEHKSAAHGSFYWYYPGDPAECYLDLKLDNGALIEQMAACAGGDTIWLVIHGDNPQRMEDLSAGGDEVIELVEANRFVGVSIYLFRLKEAS
jgi:uncharacterized membrane protein